MRRIIKQFLPPNTLRALRNAKQSASLALIAWTDMRRFAGHYSRDAQASTGRHLQARLIFHAHAIEKGLSHSNIRYRFGASAIESLISIIDRYSRQGHSKDEKAYQMALSVLSEYSKVHEAQGIWDTPLSAAPEWLLNEIRTCPAAIGGVTALERTHLTPKATEGFNAVAFGRRSVREYGSELVSAAQLDEAIRVASQAPSVCNRQSVRVRVARSADLIEKVLQIQGGFTGYPPPPVLLTVTADARDYVAGIERNQPYIDGGLFSMALLFGLEAANLAACALNAMFSIDQEQRLRSALQIEDSEMLIMFIAVGTFPSSYKVAKSFRYDVAELAR